MTLSTAQLKVLSANIFHYFKGVEPPPADEIYVPVEAIKYHDEDDTFSATVRFVVEYCGRKVHSIRIKFKVDGKGRFLTNSWSYV